jgi:ketosteroid isomerase-like protein
MASPDADRLRRAYDLFNAGDVDWAMFDPAVRNDHTAGLFLDGVFYGTEGVRAAFEEIDTDWDDVQLDPEEVIDLGDRFLVLLHMRARVRGSDAQLDAQIAHVWEFRDGRVVNWDVYGDRATAMKAISATGPFDARSTAPPVAPRTVLGDEPPADPRGPALPPV